MYKVIKIDEGTLYFNNNLMVFSENDPDGCERHWLDFSNLTLSDFDGLEFDLESKVFFERVENYGVRLVASNGQKVSVPGYGVNNGYYSSNLTLIVRCREKESTFWENKFDITECQEEKEY